MIRRDWLLLLIARAPGPNGLDPVRIQKGMFLMAQEGALPAGQRYRFVAYNYGPMSRGVYRGVAHLRRSLLVEAHAVEGHRWRRYLPTPDGVALADDLAAAAAERAPLSLRRLDRTAAYVASVGFAELLASIYDRYPEYEARSVFRRP
jgi:hypothetical protein